jgi:hypothetical protein
MKTTNESQGALQERPDFLPTVPKSKASGSENVSHQDLEIPRIGIIQDLSPQRKKNDPAYIPGAEEGMMFNTVTGELYTDPLMVIPVFFLKEWVIWVDRKSGGGFRGSFSSLQEANAAKDDIDEPCDIIETAQHFSLISSDGGVSWSEAVLSLSKSGLSVSRKWNSMIMLKEADRFGQVYKITPVQKTNSNGSFYVPGIQWHGWAKKEWYEAGKTSYEMIKDGRKNVVMDNYNGSDSDDKEELSPGF